MFWIGISIPRNELIKNGALDDILNIDFLKNYIWFQIKDYFREKNVIHNNI